MAYREPRFMFLHAAQLAGDAGLSSNETLDADFPKAHAIDGRLEAQVKLDAAAGGDWTLTVDRGAGSLEAIDRLIIPAGHNLASVAGDLMLEADDNSGFTTPTTLLDFTPAAGLIDQSFTSNTERYVRLKRDNAAVVWQLGELYLTRTRQPTRGPVNAWEDPFVPNVETFQTLAGVTGSEQFGSPRRTFNMVWRGLSGTDLAVFDELLSRIGYGPGIPFYFDPPEDSEPAIFVELLEQYQRKQDAKIPQQAIRYEVGLSLIEAVG